MNYSIGQLIKLKKEERKNEIGRKQKSTDQINKTKKG